MRGRRGLEEGGVCKGWDGQRGYGDHERRDGRERERVMRKVEVERGTDLGFRAFLVE